MRFLLFLLLLTNSISAEAGRIRLRKVKDTPRSCTIMKEDVFLSRSQRKILGTEKNSLIFDSTISLVGDLGQKICEWSKERFYQIDTEPEKISFYIDEFKNILIAYKKSANIVNQVQINIDKCEFQDFKTLTEVSFPKCDPPKKIKKKKSKKKKKNKIN